MKMENIYETNIQQIEVQGLEKDLNCASAIEHIRLRPYMYVCQTGDGSLLNDGIYRMLDEVLKNAIAEFNRGCCDKIEVTVDEDGKVIVRDNGRGIPPSRLLSVLTKGINDKIWHYDSFGLKIVYALSKDFIAKCYHDGEYAWAHFSCGNLIDSGHGRSDEHDGTSIEFLPDGTIFKDFKFHDEILQYRILRHAFTNSGLEFCLNGRSYKSQNGLKDWLFFHFGIQERFFYKDNSIEFAFDITAKGNYYIESYVNGIITPRGGSHQNALANAIIKTLKSNCKEESNLFDNIGIVGAINIKLTEPKFEDSAKTRLASKYTDNLEITIYAMVKKRVDKVIRDYLKKDKYYPLALLYHLRIRDI